MVDTTDCEVATGENKTQDMLFKLIVIGEPSVGKSCVLNRAVKNEFKGEYEVTIGAEFNSLFFLVRKHKIQLQVWDTAGMEKFRSIIKVFFNGAQAAFLVYDITRRESFDKLDAWFNMLQETAAPNVKIILVGNKIDKEKEREVPTELAKAYAEKHHFIEYVETSAKTGENIMPSFLKMAKVMYLEYEGLIAAGVNKTSLDQPERVSGLQLNTDKIIHKKKGCC